ncbi:STAS domain-containing protein [Streptomyces sp. CdTB01]|uniref:STAS domain-containing protein n=1 Tax=Streptomyces sp. CdTB01 TaxID=1725411 RepID=UPI00073A5D8A|nr:STAS domain-containing protein [Streptomyces sp. CdTB01]ALV35865.1 anti-anti-sigma factor [Streptomyces sp. CdTB01]
MEVPCRTPSGTDPAPRLTVFPLPDGSGLRVGGEVGLATLAQWEGALSRAAREARPVYRLELSALTFVDVAGTDALAAAAQSLEEGRRIVLQQPPVSLRRLLDLFWPGIPTIEVPSS